ncbi:MAG: TadE/TadG family type IV pilus assembly protein [Mesorhizobium sp.]
MIRRFIRSRSGNFAILTSVLAIPLILAMGLAVDYSRYLDAKRHMQDVADATSLALAGSQERDEAAMRVDAQRFVDSNFDDASIDQMVIAGLDITENDVTVKLDGYVHTTFMAIAGHDKMPVAAESLAIRAVTGSVEVALVLDNTYSMDEEISAGVKKITALKTAANALVTELLANPKADVKIALVPYADHVNIGLKYRNEPWLDVPADYTVPAVQKSGCRMEASTTKACIARAPSYQCTTYYDGVPITSTCTGACTAYGPEVTTQKEVCDVTPKAAVNYKWYGCIGSRKTGQLRLNDTTPSVPYPGYVETSQKCLNPIVTLTNDKNVLKSAIDGMIINIGTSHRPKTYIPAGVVWGINVLSPTAPLVEGKAYDPDNKVPRKAMLLMTDGENTLRFQASNGKHVDLSNNKVNGEEILTAAGLAQLATVNKETVDLCTYAKQNKIEVYSVAFRVQDPDAKKVMLDCATSAEHYFDASDQATLLAAFSGIAQSLSVVRLAR